MRNSRTLIWSACCFLVVAGGGIFAAGYAMINPFWIFGGLALAGMGFYIKEKHL